MSHGETYQRFLNLCRPYSLGGAWQEFQEHTDLWWPPTDSSAALATLREQFDDRELLAKGLAVGDPGDTMTLSPILRDPQTIILALRKEAEHAPFDLVVNDRSLSGQLPLHAALKDGGIRTAAVRDGYLALTFSMDDLAALRLMGIPAAPAHGLAHMRREALTEFCQCLENGRSPGFGDGRTRPASLPKTDGAGSDQTRPLEQGEPVAEPSTSSAEVQATESPLELIFVGWSPGTPERVEPEQLKDIVLHFARIEQYLRVPMNDFYVWRAKQAELDRLMFCLRHGTRKDVQEALVASLDESAEPITAAARNPAAPKSLPEATRRLENVLRGPFREDPLEKQAWADYQEGVESELAMPLLRLAVTMSEPVQRNLVAATASVTRVLHPQAMLIAASITRRIAKAGFDESGRVVEKDIVRLLQLTDRLIDLYKELRECKRCGKARAKPTRH